MISTSADSDHIFPNTALNIDTIVIFVIFNAQMLFHTEYHIPTICLHIKFHMPLVVS